MKEGLYPFDSLTKEMILSQLAGELEAPQKAAQIALMTLATGIKGTMSAGSSQTPRASTSLVFKGLIEGLREIGSDPVFGTLEMMRGMDEVSSISGISKSELLLWGMDAALLCSKSLGTIGAGYLRDSFAVEFPEEAAMLAQERAIQ